jgi:uncharacterized protein YjiS (DUF1127 family)
VIVDERSLSSDFGYHSGTFPSGARSWLTALNRLSAQITVAVVTAAGIVAVWKCRRHSRRALRSLDRREVRDFCLDSMETEREASKPFWRP